MKNITSQKYQSYSIKALKEINREIERKLTKTRIRDWLIHKGMENNLVSNFVIFIWIMKELSVFIALYEVSFYMQETIASDEKVT